MLLRQVKGCIWLFRCDCCDKEFEAQLTLAKKRAKTHGCSRACGSKASRATVRAGLLEKHGVENVSQLQSVRDKVKQTTLEHYGVEHAFQAAGVKAKIVETMIERYGADHVMHSDVLRARVEQTNMARVGAAFPFQSAAIQAKVHDTMRERYGVDNPQQIADVHAQTQQTCLERHGAPNPRQSPKIVEEMKQRCLAEHGVEHTWQREDVKQKSRATCRERYGVDHPMQSPVVQQRAIDSFKRKGKGFISRDELACFEELRSLFGIDNVLQQVPINGWLIDFRVATPCGDMWIQFDGAYWHGLTRPRELIENPVTARDRDIARKWHRDREQERWFAAQGLKLVRIVDADFREWRAVGTLKHVLTTVFDTVSTRVAV